MVASLLVAAAALLAFDAQDGKTQRERLEWFKKLTPREKQQLRERLEMVKKLSPEERARLQENLKRLKNLPPEARQKLQDKVQQLTPEERKVYGEVAQIYFKQIGRKGLQGFPRAAFFMWLKNAHPTAVERIRYLEPPARAEHFERLVGDFREASLRRAGGALQNAKMPPERLDALRDAPPERFWVELNELMREIREKQAQQKRTNGKRPPPK